MTDDAAHEDLLPFAPQRWLWAVGALQVLLLAVAAVLPAGHLEYRTCQLMFGIVISQSVLAAAWLTLGPDHLVLRCVGAPLWALFTAGVAGILDRPSDAFSSLLSFALGAMLAISVLLFGSRLFVGWRLRKMNDNLGLPLQYGLKHLMILMAAVSVFAAAFTGMNGQLSNLFVGVFGGVLAVGLVSSVIVPVLPVTRGWLFASLALAGGISFLAAIGLGFGLVKGFDGLVPDDYYWQIVIIEMSSYFATTGSMLLVRAAGYRLLSGKRK